jgi:hypothetical protein
VGANRETAGKFSRAKKYSSISDGANRFAGIKTKLDEVSRIGPRTNPVAAREVNGSEMSNDEEAGRPKMSSWGEKPPFTGLELIQHPLDNSTPPVKVSAASDDP